jgi:hypothetical protein
MRIIATILVGVMGLFGCVATDTPPIPSPAAQYHDLAIAVGWDEANWPTLECLINRESNGNPNAYNRFDPGFGSYGLLQINMGKGTWGTFNYYSGVLGGDRNKLFDPEMNLRVGLHLWYRAQEAYGFAWYPWKGTNIRCW